MTYHRARFIHDDDAHAAVTVLEALRPRVRCGLVATTVSTDAGEVVEWEVWCALPETRRHSPHDVEPDEHDRGRSTIWDEDEERRASRD